jgi:hypothetical protein
MSVKTLTRPKLVVIDPVDLFVGTTPRLNGSADFRAERVMSIVCSFWGLTYTKSYLRVKKPLFLSPQMPLFHQKSITLINFLTVTAGRKVSMDNLYKIEIKFLVMSFPS